VNEVRKLANDARAHTVERNRQIDDGVFAATEDPRIKSAPPKKEEVPPFLNFAPLDNGMAALQRAAEVYAQAIARVSGNSASLPAGAALREANARLIAVERALTLKEGLPNRDWFKNQIYAPGFYTGYGVKTLPGVRESIEQKDWKLADAEIVKVGKVLENAGEAIQGATTELARAAK
jgi:N-acetylated-alpha-linked acidic dipeptidase